VPTQPETMVLSGQIDPERLVGLSSKDAAERLSREGYNELPAERHSDVLTIALQVIREPMFLLLVACGVIYLLLGDVREAVMLLGFVFVIMGITLSQERKTERALEALRDLSSPRALVVRDGLERRIAGREVVRGDILVLNEGDRVPADAVVLFCINLAVDESLLTGESAPVRKKAGGSVSAMASPGGDDLPFLYSGTLVVKGRAVARVEATGVHTEMGRIGKTLQDVKPERTHLQRETGRLVGVLSLAGLMLCLLVLIGYGLTRDDWLHGLLAGLTLAMAMIPEEFPVVLTVFLALGAWRISRKHVLTRRVPAVETLGAATVLCADKTGTLTLNRMSVKSLFAAGGFLELPHGTAGNRPLPEAFSQLLTFASLASQKDPFDPMEKAIKHACRRHLSEHAVILPGWRLVHEYPLSAELLALSHAWESPEGGDFLIAAKGAPEAIADLCHLDRNVAGLLSAHVSEMAGQGLRVLGVARADLHKAALPGEQHDFRFEFLGLVGLSDPVRPSVPEAIRACYAAGIRPVMITGDYAGTALNVAQEIGLDPGEGIVTGPELDSMTEDDLLRRIRHVNIFARVVPEQKLRLVSALRARGEIVAMTGDGVNDAPALKTAHIGIAMGGRGTDVARESAALVLLDDDFSSIVQAIRLGRRIFDNIKKAMAYILAIHVPIAGISLIPVLFKWPLVLMPVHIVFLELIIDPACSIAFEAEPEEADVLTRPPRDPREPLFSRRMLLLSLLQGMSIFLILLVVFGVAMCRGYGDLQARALTFTTLIVANLALILTNRSWSSTILATLRSPNPALWWVMGSAAAFLSLILSVPFLRELFRFGPLQPVDIVVCVAAGIISIGWFEGLKLLHSRKNGPSR